MGTKELLRKVMLNIGSRASVDSGTGAIVLDNITSSTPQGNNSGISKYFTAPYDGVLYAFLQAGRRTDVSSTYPDPGISIRHDYDRRVAIRTQDGGVSMPLAKGDTVLITSYDEGPSVSQRRIHFYKTIGGGQ